MKKPKVETYVLYRWDFTYTELGEESRHRGKRIASFDQYRDLVAFAKKMTAAAGYPQNAWMYLYDWNLQMEKRK